MANTTADDKNGATETHSPEVRVARLNCAHAIEQTPADADEVRYHLREAAQLLKAYEVDG